MEKSWLLVAHLLEQVAHIHMEEWRCGLPAFDSLPDEESDLIVSAWCFQMADNLLEPINPPDFVKPWILARLLSASVQAKLEDAAKTPCPEICPESLRNMLVASWHQVLRDKWNLMVTLELPEV